MGLCRKALGALCVILCASWTVAVGQEAATSGSGVSDPLSALRATSHFERGKVRARLVRQVQQDQPETADQIVQAALAEFQGRHESDDVNLVGHCILLLGELKAEQATDPLLEALEDADLQISYQAATALGVIWEGRGGSGAEVQKVNLALAAKLYGEVPNLLVPAPGIALCRINNILPADQAGGLSVDQLRARVDQWVAANGSSLPPLLEQPWQMVLRLGLTTQDTAERDRAIAALRDKGDLEPIEPILGALVSSDTPDSLRTELAALLGALTGLPYAPPEGTPPWTQAAVSAWRAGWYKEVRQRADQKHADYVWHELEGALRSYLANPSDAAAARVADLRAALLYLLPDPDAVPVAASATVKEFLTEPLTSKGLIADNLTTLQNAQAGDLERKMALDVIRGEVKLPHGPVVGAQFVNPLVAIAYNEANTTLATLIGEILSEITRIPLQLNASTLDSRRAALRKWIEKAREKKSIDVRLP